MLKLDVIKPSTSEWAIPVVLVPVGYFNRGLEPAEQNYTVTEIEGLGVVWAGTSLPPYSEVTLFLVSILPQKRNK